MKKSISIKELANEERKAYAKKWRAANKDRVRKHQETYWTRKAEQRLNKEGGE